jgi:hypothetical protein
MSVEKKKLIHYEYFNEIFGLRRGAEMRSNKNELYVMKIFL